MAQGAVIPDRARRRDAYDAEHEATLRAFAENLRRLREQAGMSQEELADRTRMHRVSIGYFEQARREPKLHTLMILADTLDVTIDDLLIGVPIPQQRCPARTSQNREPRRATREHATVNP